MDSNFNKVLSFFLGLVVVVVFFAILTGRINLKKTFPFIGRSATVTPTPTQQTKATPTPISTIKITNNENNRYNNRYQTKNPVKNIPATGSPTEVLLIVSALSSLGFFLKTTKPRNF